MADQPDPLCLDVHARFRLVGGEDVLPDRVAWRGVEEPDSLARCGWFQSPQELQGPGAGVLAGPLDCRRRSLREGGGVERVERRQVVVADETDLATPDTK